MKNNDDKYEGEFHQGEFHGEGVYTHGVMNLGVSAYRCALDSVFLIDDCMDAEDRVMQEQLTEKKRNSSGLK